jgi:hypothetical protein
MTEMDVGNSLTNNSNSKHVVLHFAVVKWGVELNIGFSCALFYKVFVVEKLLLEVLYK